MPGGLGGERLQREQRLRCSRDFERVSQQGRRVASRYFVLLVSRHGDTLQPATNRLGVTVSRKVGRAVVRNRVKRRIRDWFRRTTGELGRGLDLVVIARPAAADLDAAEAARELSRLALGTGR